MANNAAVPGSRALSSIHGKIELILLSFPNLAESPLEVHDRFVGLFRALPRDAKFAIIVQYRNKERSGSAITRFARSVREHFVDLLYDADVHPNYLESLIIDPLVDYKAFHRRMNVRGVYHHRNYLPSEWTQDPFVVLKRSPDSYALLEPLQFTNTNIYKLGDQLIADYVAAQLDFLVKPFALQLEGGNVLIGDRFAMIGSEILYKNWLYFRESLDFAQITQYFQWNLGLETIIWIGADAKNHVKYDGMENSVKLLQKLRHIDMFITLGGKTRDNVNLVFVAQLTPESCIAVDDKTRDNFNRYFDRIAEFLNAYDDNHVRFQVERLPLLFYNVGDRILMSFNNCLVEEYEEGKFAYIPQYKARSEHLSDTFEHVENLAIEQFEKFDFRVQSIPGDFSVRAGFNASVHCMAKVLKRSDFGELGRSPHLVKPDLLWLDELSTYDIGRHAARNVAPFLLAGDISSHFR